MFKESSFFKIMYILFHQVSDTVLTDMRRSIATLCVCFLTLVMADSLFVDGNLYVCNVIVFLHIDIFIHELYE